MRFSLSTLLLWVTGLAIYFAVVFALPFIASYVCLMLATVFIMPVVVTGIVYERGYARAFWIGCAGPAVIPMLSVLTLGGGFFLPIYALMDGDIVGDEGRIYTLMIGGSHGLVFLSGGVGVAARWLIEHKHRGRRMNVAEGGSILHGRVTVADLQTAQVENE
jgi:hypothetical protein